MSALELIYQHRAQTTTHIPLTMRLYVVTDDAGHPTGFLWLAELRPDRHHAVIASQRWPATLPWRPQIGPE